MTAPVRPVHINQELVDRFKAYGAQHDLWGSFHRQLFDGDLEHQVDGAGAGDAEELELARFYNLMSFSQRRKLRAHVVHADMKGSR